MTGTKFISYLEGLHIIYIPYSENTSKYDIADSKEDPPPFFFNLVNFPRIAIKSNSWRIAQKIFCKKVKQVLQSSGGETGVTVELQKKSK